MRSSGSAARIDDRDLEPSLARRGGELVADPASADDNDVATEVQTLAQRVAVGESAQIVNSVELSARNRDPARFGAGGKQQPVDTQPIAHRQA